MKKLMVCADLNEDFFDIYKKELTSEFLAGFDEVHFVHGFQTQVYAMGFYLTAYPSEDQVTPVKSSVEELLKDLANKTVEQNFDGEIITKCILSSAPKDDLVNYASENKVTDMAIATRGKTGVEGFFSSSFAEFMVRHAPSRLHIFRK